MFETIQNNVQLCVNTREESKMYKRQNAVYDGSVKLIILTKIYKVSVSVDNDYYDGRLDIFMKSVFNNV
jgi:hypothetical protein